MSDENKSTRIFLREELKKSIDTILQGYFTQAHSNAITPFAIADLKENSNEVGLTYYLEIELVDENDDTTDVEIKCDEIKKILDRKKSIVQNYAYIIFFENCLIKINEEKFIKTRLLTFTIRLYEFT